MNNTERWAWLLAVIIACTTAWAFWTAFERNRCPCPRQPAEAAPIAPDVEAILQSYGVK